MLTGAVGENITPMSFTDIFKSREERARLSHLKSLIAMAAADGHVDNTELAAIALIAKKEGMSNKDIKRCLTKHESVKFVVPKREEDKSRYLANLVIVMMADGFFDEREKQFCKIIGSAYGMSPSAINHVIETLESANS